MVAAATVRSDVRTIDESEGQIALVSIEPMVTRQDAVANEYAIVDAVMGCGLFSFGIIISSPRALRSPAILLSFCVDPVFLDSFVVPGVAR